MGIAIGPKLVTCFLPTHLLALLPWQGKAEMHQLGLIMGLVGLPDEASSRVLFAPKVWGTFATEIKAN